MLFVVVFQVTIKSWFEHLSQGRGSLVGCCLWAYRVRHNWSDLAAQQLTLLEKAMTPHSSTLACKIPWMEEPGKLQSIVSLRVGHNWATSHSLFTFIHWRKKWQSTPVFLPGESQGQESLVGCCLWGRTESDWSDLAAAATAYIICTSKISTLKNESILYILLSFCNCCYAFPLRRIFILEVKNLCFIVFTQLIKLNSNIAAY